MAEIRRNLGIQVNLGSKDQTGPGLNAAERNLKQFQDQLNNTTSAVTTLASAGTKLAALGASLTTLTIFPTKTAADFEKTMSGVRAVTQGTSEDFEEMANLAKDLGATTKFTASEAAGGLRALGMAGLDVKEIMTALPATLDLAAAGELAVADAARISSNLMRAMQLPVTELGHVMDVLANTASSATTDVQELSEAARYVASTASVAGINIDELGAYLKVLADNGKQGTVAGTALRGVIIALNNVTPKAQKTLERLGVQIAKNNDGTINYVETFKRLRDANLNIADAVDIFRRTSFEAALNLAQNVETIEEFTKANEKAEGAAQKMGETMLVGVVGALTDLRSALEGLAIALGEPLLEPIENAIDRVTGYVRAIREIVKEHPEATRVILATTGAFGGSLLTIGSTIIILGTLTRSVLDLVKGYQLLINTQLGVHLVNWLGGIEALKLAVIALAAEFTALSYIQQATVIGVIIATSVAVNRAIGAFSEWRSAVADNREAAQNWRDEMSKHKDVYDEVMGFSGDLATLNYKEAVSWKEKYKAALQYQTAAVAATERLGESSEKESEILDDLQNKYKVLNERIRDIQPLEPIPNAVGKSFDDLGENIRATQEQYEKFVEVYDSISERVKSYTDQVIEWDEQILWSKLSTQEKINQIRREDSETHNEMLESQREAETTLSTFREALQERDFELADSTAQKIKAIYESTISYSSTALSSIKRHFDDVIASAERAYQSATREVEKYAQEVLKIEKEILDSKKSGEEILRELTRQTLSEEEQWQDRRAEAEENLMKLREAAASGDKRTLEEAIRLADETIRKYRNIAVAVEAEGGIAGRTLQETTQLAKDGIEEVLRVKERIYDELLNAAQEARLGAEQEADRIKQQLDEAVKLREAIIQVKLEGLDTVKNALDNLEADIRTVKVKVETTEAGGGPVHTFARGGRLPGESRRDSIPVLARPGEWFIRNEAAHFWEKMVSPLFMHGVNNPWSQAGEKIRGALQGIQNFSLGGSVQNLLPRFADGGITYDSSKLANALRKIESLASVSSVRSLEMQSLGRLELGLGGRIYPVLGEVTTLDQLKNAIERERLVRSNA